MHEAYLEAPAASVKGGFEFIPKMPRCPFLKASENSSKRRASAGVFIFATSFSWWFPCDPIPSRL